MNICLTLDDFSVLNTRLDLLWKLREHFDDFRVSLFMIPDDIRHKTGNRDEALVRIRECLGWVELIPHGYQHNSSEAKKWTYDQFRYDIAPKIKDIFDRDELPFKKGFKAPHWDWNQEVVRALDDMGWFGAVTYGRKGVARPRLFYISTHTIEYIPMNQDIKLNGHINNTSPDNLEKCMNNLIQLPKDTRWLFASDCISESI